MCMYIYKYTHLLRLEREKSAFHNFCIVIYAHVCGSMHRYIAHIHMVYNTYACIYVYYGIHDSTMFLYILHIVRIYNYIVNMYHISCDLLLRIVDGEDREDRTVLCSWGTKTRMITSKAKKRAKIMSWALYIYIINDG